MNEVTRPTAVIGDVHGLDCWRQVVQSHPGCRVVFLGDYLDPIDYVPRRDLLANLRAIIALRRARPSDVVLLGNHDLHYFSTDAPICSRFDWQIGDKASLLFLENIDAFQYAFQDGRTIFTHAGIAHGWFVNDFKGDISRPIADQLNNPSDGQVEALCRVGQLRGGKQGTTGGIFWADSDELADPLHGFTQVVGHNRVEEVTTHEGGDGGKIVFCDCLWNGNYLFME